MKILFYLHQYPAFGGIETVTTMLARQFAIDGHELTIVALRQRSGTRLLESLPRNIEVLYLPEDAYDSAMNFEALRQILNNKRPHIVIYQDSYTDIDLTLLGALNKCDWGRPKLLVVEHSMPRVSYVWPELCAHNGLITNLRRVIARFISPLLYLKRYSYERRRRCRLYDAAYKYVFLSSRYIPKASKIAGLSLDRKAVTIPNPIQSQHISSRRKAKEKVVLYCGSLLPVKRVDRLLKIWSRVEGRFPEWRFVIVGDGSERLKLESMIKRLALRNVELKGYQVDTTCYYERASILVMASSFEGWPMVLGESMLHGCVPVSYNSFPAIYDIIDDGVNGIIVPNLKRSAFVGALCELMADKERLMKMQCEAVKKTERYDIKTVSKEWYRQMGVLN